MLAKGGPLAFTLLPLGALRRGMASMSSEVVTGLNTLKKGQDPALKQDEELPEWLWALAEPEKTLNEMRRMKSDEITPELLKRFVKLENREGIREVNHSRAK
ncbi:hypothetical protein D9Q98_001752 [Chlorella vulgaris]|uniref:Large ribosomal subunit protein mL54 n=1 Tax=Chlorella vulgaris TaxID=3077 RepID=A0A9D4TV59_CHLVU|nr:hypothetical protein D9Q98_001752 [Chlorella vulgaris]